MVTTATLRSGDTARAARGDTGAGPSPCPAPRATLTFPKVAPSEQSNMSVNSIKEKPRPWSAQQKSYTGEKGGEFWL